MATRVTIRDETAAGKPLREWMLDLLTDRPTVRELIRSRVYQEVDDFHRSRATVFQGLVQPTETEATLNGFRLKAPRTLDWRAQFDRAVEAFEKNRILVIVGERQVESLDETVEVRPDTVVSFLRLVPLVGG
jgi:hypothetical protein